MKIPTLRVLLTDLGIGNFNATMIIPFMFMAPASTDPKQPSVLMLVRAIQQTLYSMGAPVRDSGMIDQATSYQLERLAGPGWLNQSWAQVVTTLLEAKKAHINLSAPPQLATNSGPPAVGLFDFLPDVPGGLLTYAVGAGALYYFLKKR